MTDRSGRYTVVKFVPDSLRFEPINIGLVLEADGRVETRMAEQVDPRVRFADPYADVGSLREFLTSFDASDFSSEGESAIEVLANKTALPNIVFGTPHGFDSAYFDAVADGLFDRLVGRRFARPAGFVRAVGPTAARTALKRVFASAKVLGPLVETDTRLKGGSGLDWDVDFRYLADQVCVIQTATTGLREDLRSSEHGFRAFAALVDISQNPGTRGILAVDETAEHNDFSAKLQAMASAHGLEFVAGRRQFLTLAHQVQVEGRPVGDGGMPHQPVLV